MGGPDWLNGGNRWRIEKWRSGRPWRRLRWRSQRFRWFVPELLNN
jgi:hypothetical protein